MQIFEQVNVSAFSTTPCLDVDLYYIVLENGAAKKKEKQVQCSECEKWLSQGSALNRHVDEIHRGIRCK